MQYSIEVNNQVEIYNINKVAKQASGAALLRVKNTVVLATVAREDTQVSEDFLPLTVQFLNARSTKLPYSRPARRRLLQHRIS